MSSTSTRNSIYIEASRKRVFACALDWPGWCRSAKDEPQAIAALSLYAPRYAKVAKRAGIAFDLELAKSVEVVERIAGSATTDFGAPGEIATMDREPLDPKEAARYARLVEASWEELDAVVAGAPAELRKGPRGGGRDRDKVFDHVLGSEPGYATKLGLRIRQPSMDDVDAIAAMRKQILNTLRTLPDGKAPGEKGWPVRYAARRIAWHALDHAWEIEDRSSTAT